MTQSGWKWQVYVWDSICLQAVASANGVSAMVVDGTLF